MNQSSTLNFAIFFASEPYSTATRIMGRQAAGKAFMKGVARTWPRETIAGIGVGGPAGQAMYEQLSADGFKGRIHWSSLPDSQAASRAGALYYPSPPSRELAAMRSALNPAAFSIMGVTHTLSSTTAMDEVANLILPPFQPWDALICTSTAARKLVTTLHEEMRRYWHQNIGATRFVDVQLPVIPLGVDAPAFASQDSDRAAARTALGLAEDEIVFLFAGRLSFHAKANPAPMYQALQKITGEVKVICVEAGVFPNDGTRHAYATAQQSLAPDVRFLWVNGQDEDQYRKAWQGADVFVSLSDNMQETFGLTPVEAMAAGLPVVVSDWNGYQDTVRDGIDGFRVPTVQPPAGTGADLALHHALGIDTYDYYIGRHSLATVVEPDGIAETFRRLATQPELRKTLATAGQRRAQQEFDWPIILKRYDELARELSTIRRACAPAVAQPWPQRADATHRFAHFSTHTLGVNWTVAAKPDAAARLTPLLTLTMVSFGVDPTLLPREALWILLEEVIKHPGITVQALLASTQLTTAPGMRVLAWLWKFDLVLITPNPKIG
ncbi:MAG: glycosyltransferase family 4 protein [Gammaproteobacteria bacterium]|nr:glycosyltransferase family 4 protein [Gammaproteobacteria bacterium]